MFLVNFCCASSRNENDESNTPGIIRFSIDPNSNALVEKKLKKLKNVLIEYMHFERSLGIQNIDILKLIELVLDQYSDNEIPKKML